MPYYQQWCMLVVMMMSGDRRQVLGFRSQVSGMPVFIMWCHMMIEGLRE